MFVQGKRRLFICLAMSWLMVSVIWLMAAPAEATASQPQEIIASNPTAPAAVSCWATIDNTAVYSSADASAVQIAVDAAASGDTVKVAGTCAGVQNVNGYTQTLYLTASDLTLQGGYTYTNWLMVPDSNAYPTVLDAQEAGRVVYIPGGYVVSISGLTLTGGNAAAGGEPAFGGGISNNGTLTLIDSLITGNTSPSWAGGLINGGNATVQDCVFVNNFGEGAALFNESSGRMDIASTTIYSNTQLSNGIIQNRGMLTVTNSTVSGNQGDGINNYANSGTATIHYSTIVSNTHVGIWNNASGAGIINLANTVVAYNDFGDCINSATFNDQGYNLIGDGTCITAGTSLSGDPLLGALADNGGPAIASGQATLTHLPLPYSPIVDRIPAGVNDCGTTYLTDQRGYPRPVDDACDIGAVELDADLYAPIANDDAYTTSAYIPLSVTAPGVLANDSDPDGDILTATLAGAPANGSLTLSGDGAFVYTPTAAFTGVDTFTYFADDGDTPLLDAYWPFEEGSGTTTVDQTGHGYDGLLLNGASFTSTVPPTPTAANPYALAFDGQDDQVQAPLIDLANRSFSVAFWARRDSSGTNDFVLGQGTNTQHNGLHIGFRNNNQFTCAFWANDLNTTATYTDNNWHHWTCTYDTGTNLRTIYRDGTAVISDTASADYQGSGDFFIGSRFGGNDPFDGLVDDVQLYLSPLTQAQVQAAMTGEGLPLNTLATVTLNVTPVSTGTLAGTVTDSSTGAPLAGIAVEAVYNPVATFAATTDAAGQYELVVPDFPYTVTAVANYGYYPALISDVIISPGLTTTLDIALDPLPTFVVSGTVTDANTGWPLYARIDITGYPNNPVWTDPVSGFYSVTLAAQTPYTFTVAAWVDGYLTESRAIGSLVGDATEDFALDVDPWDCVAPGYTEVNLFYDGFESGDLLAGGWLITTTNEGRVRVDTYDPYQGNYSVLLDDSVDGSLSSIAGIILPIDLSAESQVYLDFWWHEYGDENDAEDGVFLSDDGGITWCRVFSFNNGPANYINTRLDLTSAAGTCGMSPGANTQILFQFYDNFAIPTDGYTIDQIKLRTTDTSMCLPPTNGGLVVGNVYDENTIAPLNAALVENELGDSVSSVATPDDPIVDDGFYTIFAPASSATLTATKSGGYAPAIDLVTVPLSSTVKHDFYLPAGWLQAAPAGLSVTLDIGLTTTLPLTLSNLGNAAAAFEMQEFNQGFDPLMLKQGTIQWLYRSTVAVPIKESDSGAVLAYPGAYRYTPAHATSSANILVYTDDWYHVSPNTLVQQALGNLGLAATVHVDGDYSGFQNDLNNNGPWDVVIWSGENYSVSASVLDDLSTYLQGGGKLAATYWRQLDYATDPLWAEMGFSYISNYLTPLPVYWWDPGNPLFTYPMNAPEWINRIQNSGTSQGTQLEPLDNGTALAGYTASPAVNEAAIIVRNDGKALYKGLRDVSTNADDNGNSILDGTELWMNILHGMLYGFGDVPWLAEQPISGTIAGPGSQVVEVTFDAGAVDQPGIYYATLNTSTDTPYSVESIPVTMTVNLPATWGKLEGTLTSLGYCDINPAPLIYRDVLIEDNAGMVYTATTDSNGYYQRWINEAASPLTVTVTSAGYVAGQAADLIITAGQVTTQDFDLRLLQPCVSVVPESYARVVHLGDTLTGTLAVINTGAISTTYDLVEAPDMPWLSQNPVSGTVAADSVQAIDLLFDSSVLTQTGWYSGELQVFSDDPYNNPIAIPVDLMVVSGTAGVALGPDSLITAAPGNVVTHTFVLSNSGNVTDFYDLILTGDTWPTYAPSESGFMAPGEAVTLSVVVAIPVDPTTSAIIGSDTFTFTAVSRLDGTSAATTGTTQAGVTTGVEIGSDQSGSGPAGAAVTYVLPVTNTGGFTDTIDLAVSGNAWSTELSATTLTLPAAQSTTVIVTVTIPVNAIGGSSDIATITASSHLDPMASDSVSLTTLAKNSVIYIPLIFRNY